jgi:integrase/recombinase XerC
VNFEPYFQYLSSEKRSSRHTVIAYQQDLSQFAVFCKRSFDIDHIEEVRSSMIRTWMAEMMEEKYAPTSIQRKISAIHSFYRFMVKNGLTEQNPARGIHKPKKPGRLPVFVEEAKMLKLYDEEDTSDPVRLRNRLIVTLLYETGIRRTELIHLTISDVDYSLKQIKVLGKRNKMRYIPVSDGLLTMIRQWKEARMQIDKGLAPDLLFLAENGKKMGDSVVYNLVKSYLSDITTMKKKSPHVLRHSFATHMLNHGADLNVIKEILGHSSLAATQVYTHNSIEKLRAIHEKLHPRQ